MKYYPAFLNLNDKKAVVIGGGKVAERKVRSLIKAGALVKVISPEITNGIRTLKENGRLKHIKRNYRNGDIKDVFIVIACTSSDETNKKIAESAGCLVNVIDAPAEGNFIVPSVVKQGRLTIAISTDGSSPAVSKMIRKEIGKQYDKEFSLYLRFVESLRKRILKEIKDRSQREIFFRSLASEEIFNSLRKKGFGTTSKKILASLKKIENSG